MKNLYASLLFAYGALATSGCAPEASESSEIVDQIEVSAQPLERQRLLALGDSIAFGYNPFGDFTKDLNFQGYPEALGADYSAKNSACPGETSASFLSETAPDNGCRSYRSKYPLHVNYGSKSTQMEYALSRVTSAEPEDVPNLITLNISGNDIFLLQAACAADPRGYAACFAASAPGLIGSVMTNVGTILGRIRAAGYRGRIVYMNLYSTTYTDPNTLGFLGALNANVANVARSFGAQIADAFGAFGAAAGGQTPCAAGLLIPNPAGGCDVHPSAEGAEVLAQSVRNAQ